MCSHRKAEGRRIGEVSQEFCFVYGKWEIPSDMQGKYTVTAYTCLIFKGEIAVRDMERS